MFPLRLVNAVLEIVCVAVMLPATYQLYRWAQKTRIPSWLPGVLYLMIVIMWANLIGWGWLTGTRIAINAPITDATVITGSIVTLLIISSLGILWLANRSRREDNGGTHDRSTTGT
jgi:hypothetical protein